MPEFDQYGNYESTDYQLFYDDDKWVLIEEIRHFQTILKEFMKHPVTSEKEIRKRQMLKDLREYENRIKMGKFHIDFHEEDFYQRSEFNNVHRFSLQKILITFNFTYSSEKIY